MAAPSPEQPHPIPGFPQVGFLKPLIRASYIEVGDYTYYDDPEGPARFEQNVLYHFPLDHDRLIIGKFCAIARGVTFIMNGANHAMNGFSTYPFSIFGQEWARVMPHANQLPDKGNIEIGHDVWIGYQATLMPGVTVGSGAIIGAHAVVSRDVPPYAIVAGNPARVVRFRFDEETIASLLEIAWWDWPIAHITTHLEAIVGADLAALLQASRAL